MAKDQTKGTSRSIYIDSQAAEFAMKRLQTEADKLRMKIDAGEASGKTMNKELAKLDQVNAKIKSVQQQLDAGLKPTLIQQQNLVRQLQYELSRLSASDKKFAEKKAEFDKQNSLLTQMRQNYFAVNEAQEGLKNNSVGFTKILQGVTAAFAGLQILESVKSLVSNFFRSGIEEANQAEAAVTSLINSLENAGRSDIFPDLIQSAEEFADRFKALDNDDITEVFTKLIDYGKLTREEMESVTEVIINFSRKEGKSLADTTDLITKALEGNGKALKVYGLNVSEAGTFSERLSLITEKLGSKVRDAEQAFENTGRGTIAKFTQSIKDAQEVFGNFLIDIVTPAPSAETALDNAKKEADELNNTINPLIQRYDELKGKTELNAEEQSELNGIIRKIVEVLPELATGFDQYGNAIDINRGKLEELNKVQKNFLQAKEADAIRELQEEAKRQADFIKLASDNINRSIQETQKWGGTVDNIKNFISDANTKIAQSQDKLLQINDKLANTYKVTLPESIQAYINAANKAKFGLAAAEKAGKTDTELTKDEEIKRNREQKELEDQKKKADAEMQRLQEKAEANRKRLLEITAGLQKEINKVALPEIEAAAANIQIELEAKINEIYANSFGNSKEQIDEAVRLAVENAKNAFDREFEKLDKIKTGEIISTKVDNKSLTDFNKLIDEATKKTTVFDRVISIFQRNRKAGLQLDLLRNPQGRERLDAELALLLEERKQKLAVADLSENEVLLIEEEYQQKRVELVKSFYLEKINSVINLAQQAVGVLDQINQAASARENSELQQTIRNNDRRKKEIERLSRTKIISEIEARKQINDIERDEQKKKDELEKKQLERGKRIALAQAFINGAMGVTSVLAAKPGVADILTLAAFRAINIGFTVATTAAQIAAISGQKFEKGGIAPGASHSQGGIKLYDTKSKRVVGEMEGGEPYMILSKNFRKNNPEFIAAALDSSMNRNGERIKPFWETRPYSRLDYSGLVNSQAIIRKFENGGIVSTGNNASDQSSETDITPKVVSMLEYNYQALSALSQTLDTLNNTIAKGIAANISLRQIDDAYEQRDRIISEATG